jgi:hypothetical protein
LDLPPVPTVEAAVVAGTAFALCGELSWRSVDGQVIALDLRTSEFHELNRSGSLLWQLLAEAPRAEQELVSHLTDRYEIDLSVAARDVRQFIEQMQALKLLNPVDDHDPA